MFISEHDKQSSSFASRFTLVVAVLSFCLQFLLNTHSQESLPDPVATWIRRNPVGTLDHLNDLVFTQGRFVAVGYNGTVVSSTNTINWIEHPIAQRDNLIAVAANSNAVVAISVTNAFTSLGLTTWSNTLSDSSMTSVDIVTGNGAFLLVRNDRSNSVVYTSPDGAAWSESARIEQRTSAMEFGANTFVAVGTRGSIRTSPDGTNWTLRASGTDQDLRSILFSGGEFLAAGTTIFIPESGFSQQAVTLRSTDGISWTNDPSFPEIQSAASGNGVYIGLKWQDLVRPVSITNWQTIFTIERETKIVFGESRFVVVGRSGHIATSTDGLEWITQNPRTVTGIGSTDVAFGNGRFVTAASRLQSSDGRFWERIEPAAASSGLLKIEFLNGRFLAAGLSGRIAISTNGLDWKLVNDRHDNSSLGAIAYGNNRYVAVGVKDNTGLTSTLILVSNTGDTWEEAPVQSLGFGTVIFENGRFIILIGSSVLTSTNGVDWHEVGSGILNLNNRAIAYGAGRFVGVGRGISISTNGVDWMELSCCEGPFADIVYAAGIFVTAGSDAKLYTSADGINWTRRTDPWPTYINETPTGIGGIAFGNGSFVIAGGPHGFLVESGQLAPEFDSSLLTLQPNGTPLLRLNAHRGQTIELQTTTDFTTWISLTKATFSQDFADYTLSATPHTNRTFYRAKVLPQP